MPTRASGEIALPQHAPPGRCDLARRGARWPSEIAGCSRESGAPSPETAGSAAAWAAASSAAETRTVSAVSVRLVELARIVEHRRQPASFHVAANPLDHLLRRQRLAKHLDRPPPPRLAHHVARRAQLLPQRSIAPPRHRRGGHQCRSDIQWLYHGCLLSTGGQSKPPLCSHPTWRGKAGLGLLAAKRYDEHRTAHSTLTFSH